MDLIYQGKIFRPSTENYSKKNNNNQNPPILSFSNPKIHNCQLEIYRTTINLNKLSKVLNTVEDLNLFNHICQALYSIPQSKSLKKYNLDNNLILGIKKDNSLIVHGMIINRPRTFNETLTSLKNNKIKTLKFYWNKQNPYRYLFNLHLCEDTKKRVRSCFINKDLITNKDTQICYFDPPNFNLNKTE